MRLISMNEIFNLFIYTGGAGTAAPFWYFPACGTFIVSRTFEITGEWPHPGF